MSFFGSSSSGGGDGGTSISSLEDRPESEEMWELVGEFVLCRDGKWEGSRRGVDKSRGKSENEKKNKISLKSAEY